MMINVVAPAKLTLSLRVVGTRDDGMHLIDAEMVTLDLADELRIDPEDSGVRYFDGDISVAGLEIASDDDLVTRALRLSGVTALVDVRKNIPAGAGLGGGSADAAAVLRWAGFTDTEAAARIGADVAFCLVGGRARVRGIGEIVEPLPFVSREFTLVTPRIHCSTPDVYRMWDEMGGPRGSNGNDLEPAALAIAPELEAVRDALAQATGAAPRLAGSGSAWFVEGTFPDAGRVVRTIAASSDVI
ncbi:MAG: 4-(cytidine 5'-diphospho)-2-C-methyl-D-erythritol kinase [Acidimicrobiales bacterium]